MFFFLLYSLSPYKTANEPLNVVKKKKMIRINFEWDQSINHRVILGNEFTGQIITNINHRK